MEFVMPILEGAWRYVLTLRISDYLDNRTDIARCSFISGDRSGAWADKKAAC